MPLTTSLAALEARMSQEFMHGEQITQSDVTAVAVLESIRFDTADLAPEGAYPKLSALSKRLSALPAFARTHPAAVRHA